MPQLLDFKTNKTDHTPGPWIPYAQGEANEYAVLGDGKRWVASFRQNGEIWSAEQIANVRLIAAAPELLKALKNMVEMANFLDLENDPHFGRKVQATIDAAREALNKVTLPPTN